MYANTSKLLPSSSSWHDADSRYDPPSVGALPGRVKIVDALPAAFVHTVVDSLNGPSVPLGGIRYSNVNLTK